MKNLNKNVLGSTEQKRTRKREFDASSHLNAVKQYMMKANLVNTLAVDKNSNIFVGGVKYERTPGLWTPGSYTQGDLLSYRRLIHQTNVMSHPRNKIQGQSRPKTTYKWRNILEQFLY